ncbi:MAG: aminotransferase class I/II-fold pyridoxal phosphate-dependent enzyme, partial [Deltaproteobacteria bacterium]|nr:aminotransferase class I/II-fold pyridoxal phosphate-dependent enzyme [Deltaproteobacteria bacterium]
MPYDFDEIIPRRGTNCLKHDFAKERGKPEGLAPLWVADLDFRAPDEVVDALVRASRHGVYGYTEVKEDYARTVADWFDRRLGWRPAPEHLVKVPGVVYALAMAVRAFTEPGDAVIIQTPVYYPFSHCVTDNRRRLVRNPLIRGLDRYMIDFDDLEKKIVAEKAKMLLLCSPHNPV